MELSPTARALVEEFREGRTRALARCISLVEDERPGFEAVLDALYGRTGRARRIGITGPPGAGKSTLTAGLARGLRERDLRVGVLAVDPTSPFSGGALLGDRIRMGELASDEGVFIRSMASRGSVGGLATATREAADLLDAFGFDRILMETVGVGQSELQVADSADSTVVVLVPESGDAVQTMKAGLMEIADLFVVNKADRSGADRLVRELRSMIQIRSGTGTAPVGHHGVDAGRRRDGEAEEPADGPERGVEGGDSDPWEVPVLRSVATEGKGVGDLAEEVDRHHRWLRESGRLAERRREHRLDQARSVLLRHAERAARARWTECRQEARRLLEGEGLSPYRTASRIAEG